MGKDSPNSTNDWLAAIRRDWDTRARENPRAYINWPDIPNEEGAFFASGRCDYERFVKPFLQRMEFDPRGKAALEIGCGIGRIARWMAADFDSYIGVDVSPEMVRKANLYAISRATFHAVSGADLKGIATGSVDFVFSFAVFHEGAMVGKHRARGARSGILKQGTPAEIRAHADSISPRALHGHLAGAVHQPCGSVGGLRIAGS
jgi:SAM-dependent methyltransferase